MGYVVRALSTKKRAFKVQFATYTGGKQQVRDIPESEYARLGFHASMTLEQAKERRDQLNAQGHVKRTEAKRIEIAKRIEKEDRVLDAFLSADDVREFEETVLFARTDDFTKRNKTDSHWRAARRIISELKLAPEDWNFHQRRFYDAFAKQRLSPSYVQKIIAILNLWGRFHSRKYQKYFEPIAAPRGHERERIADRYYDKDANGRVSDPITPEMLEARKSRIPLEWYNWFYLTVWFGLRPHEVDQLKKPSGPRTWWAGVKNGVPYLAVYQTKLTSVPREKRAKIIPCIVPEQTAGLKIIEGGDFRRPSHSRFVQSHFGENTTLIGGRKGFEDLMRSLGQQLEDIANWMGHQSIERTWRNYKDKQAIHFNPVTRQSPGEAKMRRKDTRLT